MTVAIQDFWLSGQWVTGGGTTYTKAGSGIEGSVGSGARAVTRIETGAGVEGLVSSGPKAVIHAKAGMGVSNLVASGTEQVTNPVKVKAGLATTDMAATGAKMVSHPRDGTVTLVHVGSGTRIVVRMWEKTGTGGSSDPAATTLVRLRR